MKYTRNVFMGLSLLMALTVGKHGHAQQEEVADMQLTYLTAEQKLLLKEQQALLDKTKNILKENLSDAQLALLNDRSISPDERTKLLRQSLSQQQRMVIADNRRILKAKRSAFRNSLTKKQRFRLRRFVKRRSIDDRKRLARRLRRLIRDNIER